MNRIKSNIFVSFLLILLSTILFFFAKDYPGTSKNFPITILLLIFILSIGQIVISIYRFKNIHQSKFDIRLFPLIIFILSFLFIYLMKFLNFFGSFGLFFLIFIYLFNIKNKKFYIIGSLILFISIYLIFEFGLKVSLINRDFLG